MSFTYTPGTAIFTVRLLVPDADATAYTFSDEEITALLALEAGRPKRAAALALETRASDEVFTSKVVRLLDIQTDGAKVSDALLARAAQLRAQDAVDELSETGDAGFAVSEWLLGPGSYTTWVGRRYGYGQWGPA